MALTQIRQFIESRLLALDPSIDLDAGSPAQQQVVEPILTRLGTDPLETGIESFILDRFAQEFPALYAGDPTVIRDTFVKPLILILEPFKREIQQIRMNQSFRDASLLSREDAEALGANVFDEPSSGGIATGVARAYFANPTTVSVEITLRFYTASGLSFYPTNPSSMTAEEMVFNRVGNLFYIDIPVKAEAAGVEYNIEPNTLSGVDGLYGVVRVDNVRRFANGSADVDTATFVARARQALTERSLVTSRGATARINNVFQGDIRAVQVIGAQDPEMQRDLLVAESPGHAWFSGRVNLYGKLAHIQSRTIDGDTAQPPRPGDTLLVYLDPYAFAGLPQDKRTLRLLVEEVVFGPLTESFPFQSSYIVRWSGALPDGVSLPDLASLEGALVRKGTVRISGLPGVGQVSLSVPNGEVHLYGHSDIYVRPTTQAESRVVLNGISDLKSHVERMTLSTTEESNTVSDSLFDFPLAGVERGDLLFIEMGDDAGVYPIVDVSGSLLRVPQTLSASASGLRYRVVKRVLLDPFAPRIPKFPFGNALANDLSTSIGSNLLRLNVNDLLLYSAAVGDTVRVRSEVGEVDFTVTGFDAGLGGQGVLVDRAVPFTGSNLGYEVFTALSPVERPLVRLRRLTLLDSAKQSTGISVPPADPVAVMPLGDFTSARVRGGSLSKSGYVLPKLTGLVPSGNVASSPPGRYSQGFDKPEGTFRSVLFPDGTQAEFPFRDDAQFNCRYFLATCEATDEAENFPPVDPRPGECLTIKSGPNAGSYLIEEVHKFSYNLTGPRKVWLYFIRIDGTFPTDTIRELYDFARDLGVTTSLESVPSPIPFPSYFSSFFDQLPSYVRSAMFSGGISAPALDEVQGAIEALSQVDYEWGDPARGVLRTYYQEPTFFEMGTDSLPTLFEYTYASGERVQFRPDARRYAQHTIVPPRLTEEVGVFELPRGLSVSGNTLTFSDSPTVLSQGVQVGDQVEVYQQIGTDFLLGRQAGSNQATLTGATVSSTQVGCLVFVGDTEEGYRITRVESPTSIRLDRVATITGDASARLYEGVPESFTVTGVLTTDPSVSQLTVDASSGIVEGESQPYRIVRAGVRRVNSSEMDAKRDGAYCYFDTEVVSFSPSDRANIPAGSYLTLKAGSYRSLGYRHLVDDPTLTYSMKETGKLELPTHVLPVGLEDSPENLVNLVGASLEFVYERADLVERLQEFLDSKQDRVTAANMLARHFLPAFVSFDATYYGGSSTAVVAKDIRTYVDTLPIETPLDVSHINDLIARRGGDPETPTKVMVTLHDWKRRAWMETSGNQLGGTETSVPYAGTPRVSYFISGPDASGSEVLPVGERIRLVRG